MLCLCSVSNNRLTHCWPLVVAYSILEQLSIVAQFITDTLLMHPRPRVLHRKIHTFHKHTEDCLPPLAHCTHFVCLALTHVQQIAEFMNLIFPPVLELQNFCWSVCVCTVCACGVFIGQPLKLEACRGI